ncbi:fibro-slime domain-containing protein [Fibrobacter sp. UBA4309]|uniref:fibro-slime domain-containing protein n=1 Tax=Fibrobacter sp. UBA4309 TaxID=1946537 RepID=UPI0025C4B4B3|nr:fibro-slime domain-containing protein [Fibrobacter sp. UBA4309]
MKLSKILLTVLAVSGLQSAFATCEGTLYLKLPNDWLEGFYVMTESSSAEARPRYDAATGYFKVDLAQVESGAKDSTFALTNRLYMPMKYIVQAEWNNSVNDDFRYLRGKTDIKCPGAGNSVYVLEDPEKPGKTLVASEKPKIKYLYFLPPDKEEWWVTPPMWSGDGKYASGKPLKPAEDRCGWFYTSWVYGNVPGNFIIFKKGDESLKEAIGIDGLGAALEPIPLDMVFEVYEMDTLFFFADPDISPAGGELFATSDNDASGNCSYFLQMTFYDTDASLHGAFTCDDYPNQASNACYSANAKYNYPGEGAKNTVPCIGVTPGIVADLLDPQTKKPTYNAASGCFVSAEAFNAMFKATPDVNVVHELGSRGVYFYMNQNGLWQYDSYWSTNPSQAFTPLNDLADSVKNEKCTGTCATAATLREEYGAVRYGMGGSNDAAKNFISDKAQQALGDVYDWSLTEPKTGLPYIDLYPVSSGEFADGDMPNVYDVLSWDERVKSEGNQHFCLEAHSMFTYRPGAFLAVRGDDDIWVYVDNKLAIDLGGLHMPAPGYVNLDGFTGASGKLETGNVYDFDMFLCDRRTTMSNLHILTNLNLVGSRQPDSLDAIRKPAARVAEIAPGFTVRNSSRSTLTIVAAGASAKKYAVMDLQGRIVRQGVVAGTETLVPNLRSGSYVVRVGADARRVNVR